MIINDHNCHYYNNKNYSARGQATFLIYCANTPNSRAIIAHRISCETLRLSRSEITVTRLSSNVKPKRDLTLQKPTCLSLDNSQKYVQNELYGDRLSRMALINVFLQINI